MLNCQGVEFMMNTISYKYSNECGLKHITDHFNETAERLQLLDGKTEIYLPDPQQTSHGGTISMVLGFYFKKPSSRPTFNISSFSCYTDVLWASEWFRPENLSSHDTKPGVSLLHYLTRKTVKSAKILALWTEDMKKLCKEAYPDKEVTLLRIPICDAYSFNEHEYVRKDVVQTMIVGGLNDKRLMMFDFPELYRRAFPEHELEIIRVAFPNRERERKFVDLCNRYGIKVTYYTNISEKKLCALYNSVDFYTYLSTDEGFSMTPGEALKSGCPVLINHIPPHDENYGNNNGVVWFDNTPECINRAYELGHRKYWNETYTWEDAVKMAASLCESVS